VRDHEVEAPRIPTLEERDGRQAFPRRTSGSPRIATLQRVTGTENRFVDADALNPFQAPSFSRRTHGIDKKDGVEQIWPGMCGTNLASATKASSHADDRDKWREAFGMPAELPAEVLRSCKPDAGQDVEDEVEDVTASVFPSLSWADQTTIQIDTCAMGAVVKQPDVVNNDEAVIPRS
jgi:hypothetical protein